jgi:LysR family transcriptional activator of nhaA
VALTEAGHAAFARAEEIFQLGRVIPDEVREAASGKVARLVVGLSDGISKLAAYALLESVLATPNLRLVCHEGEVEQLLGELALHHLDLVLAGQADRFPSCLNELPILLPTGHSALRLTLEHWFEAQGLRPRIVGEFEDSALMAVFAARGLGVFPVSRLGAEHTGMMRGLRLLGSAEGVKEEIHAIRSRRGQHHPLVRMVMAAAAARGA